MAEFIELTEHHDGRKVLVNMEYIMEVRPDESGSWVYFVAVTGNGNGATSLEYLHVAESYATLKHKLGL